MRGEQRSLRYTTRKEMRSLLCEELARCMTPTN